MTKKKVMIGYPITAIHAFLLANKMTLLRLEELSGVNKNTLHKAKKGEGHDWNWKSSPDQAVGDDAAQRLADATGIDFGDIRSLQCRLSWFIPVLSTT